jgi:hypothetical protein
MSFPGDYPFVLPIATFDPGVFHPLISAEEKPADDDVFVDAQESADARGARIAGSLNLKAGFPPTSVDESTAERGRFNVIEILLFIRSCFDDVKLLNNVKEVDVVDEDAWKAWVEHRRVVKEDEDESTWNARMNLLINSNIANEELFDHVAKGLAISN